MMWACGSGDDVDMRQYVVWGSVQFTQVTGSLACNRVVLLLKIISISRSRVHSCAASRHAQKEEQHVKDPIGIHHVGVEFAGEQNDDRNNEEHKQTNESSLEPVPAQETQLHRMQAAKAGLAARGEKDNGYQDGKRHDNPEEVHHAHAVDATAFVPARQKTIRASRALRLSHAV